ncbi:hypothetical protein K2173_014642 [Erythroxylum novogranatense]|uniref:catalase n=1 Tax=Erythroxylum novogranatense TaxID=1862640 RepID=A0AAV8TFB6_9ROSI|nr:hypothetical protein K2173_014642 [Erythroxylum novogranatense]
MKILEPCLHRPSSAYNSPYWTTNVGAPVWNNNSSLLVTHDIFQLTCADFLRAPGVQTPVIVRFSTVIHERGSPETLRDPRGFAVKFTPKRSVLLGCFKWFKGNFDLVGNNFPVFFNRDAMKFQTRFMPLTLIPSLTSRRCGGFWITSLTILKVCTPSPSFSMIGVFLRITDIWKAPVFTAIRLLIKPGKYYM